MLSAFGAATADVRRERLRLVLASSRWTPTSSTKVADGARAPRCSSDLAADGIPSEHRQVDFEADLRFLRQVWELPIPLPGGHLDDAAMSNLADAFRDEYGRRYGAGPSCSSTPVEFVSLRAVGIGRTLKATIDARICRKPVPTRSRSR